LSDFDSVYLIPKGISSVSSRTEVDLCSKLGVAPFISSPMKNISGSELVIEMGRNDCIGILHRFDSALNRINNIGIIAENKVPFGVAIGINNWEVELAIADYAVNNGAWIICIDVANGYIPQLGKIGKLLKSRYGNDVFLMSGNVITIEGSDYLKESGYDFVRVGIGSSKFCATREVTGIGRNQLAAIEECSETDTYIVSDGGVSIPANAVKSFAFGADFCMLGTALSYANEAENKDGKAWGMASKANHVENHKEIKSIEGKEFNIDPSEKKPLKEILDQFKWGVKSACTYLNCKSYKEIPYKCKVVSVNEKLDY
jgi:IMP dehydrogenase/GMP reductase